MSQNADKLKPYAYGFAVSNSWLSQSNAIEKFVSKAAKLYLYRQTSFTFQSLPEDNIDS